jgi:hypothetical protein
MLTKSFAEKFPNQCGIHRIGFQPRIGLTKEDTASGEWPHMCAIFKFASPTTTATSKTSTTNTTTTTDRDEGFFLAGASLITPGTVLTVAHWIA